MGPTCHRLQICCLFVVSLLGWCCPVAGCVAGCLGLPVGCLLCWLVGCLVVGCAVGQSVPQTPVLLAQGRNPWEWGPAGCLRRSVRRWVLACLCVCVCVCRVLGGLVAVWLVGGCLGLAGLWLLCCLGFGVGCSAGLALGRLAGCVVGCVCVCACVAWSSPPFTASASRGSARSSRPARGNEGGREGEDWGLDAGGREGGR